MSKSATAPPGSGTSKLSDFLDTLDESSLELDEQIRLVWMRVSDLLKLQCEGNPKLHDFDKIACSLARNGFQDPPKWDEQINEGRGGLLYGNGRIEALSLLEGWHQDDPEKWPKPRGVAIDKQTGDWAVQVKIGVGCLSPTQAKQFLIDHNSLTLGGNFDAATASKIYDAAAYRKVLLEIQSEVGDGEDLTITTPAGFLQDFPAGDLGDEDSDEYEDDEPLNADDEGIEYQSKYAVLVECADEAAQEKIYVKLKEQGYQCKPLTV